MTPLICPTCGAQTPRLTGASGAVTCLKCRAPIPAEHLAPPSGEAGAEAPSVPAYHVEAFQPTRGGSPAGVFAALGFGLVAADVLGGLAAFIRQFFWLVLVFPALYGAGLGIVTAAGAWLARCRRPELAIGAGVVVGLVGAFTMHYASYLIAVADLPPGAAAKATFGVYLDFLCQAGVMGFGYTGAVIYYLVEVVVIVIAAGACAPTLLNGPFCEPCNVWKQKEPLGTFKINTAVAAAAVASGQPVLMVAPPDGEESVTLDVFRCIHCRNNGPIEVRATCTRGSGENAASLAVFMTYPGEAAADFEEIRRRCTS